MTATTWTKFYWSDWANDPKLKLCSLAAQGLWMRCLCIAAEADPTGYVTVNGRPLGVTDIARLAGVTETECEPLLAELDRNGVFSRARNGTIYSRRMIKDHKKATEARKVGATGGNPKLIGGNDKAGFVYVMGPRQDGAYKIGASGNPQNRLKKAKTVYGCGDLQLVTYWPVEHMGAGEVEAHREFAAQNCGGEWFFLNDANICSLKEKFRTLKGHVKPRDKTHKPEARSQTESVSKKTLSVGWDGPAEIREEILKEKGEDFCRSYLDGAAWIAGQQPGSGSIRPRSGIATLKLVALDCLSRRGISVILPEKAA